MTLRHPNQSTLAEVRQCCGLASCECCRGTGSFPMFPAPTDQPAESPEARAVIDRETAARTAFRAIQPAMDKIANAKPSEASPFTSGGMLRAAEMIADALRAMPAATTARPTERGAVEDQSARDRRMYEQGWKDARSDEPEAFI